VHPPRTGSVAELGLPLAQRAVAASAVTAVEGASAAPAVHCAVASECGGCPLIRISADGQRELKLSAVRQAFLRNDIAFPEVFEWIAHDGPPGYRGRIRLRLDQGRPTFFNPDKHPECVVLEAGLLRLLWDFRAWARCHRDWLYQFSHLELRAPDLEGRGGLQLTPHMDRVVAFEEPSLSRLRRELNVLVWITGQGPPPVQRLAGVDVTLQVPLNAFVQVNRWVNRRLVRTVCDVTAGLGARSVLDLYCGAGNFGLPLLQRGFWVGGVEGTASAVVALNAARLEQLPGSDGSGAFLAEDVNQFVQREVASGRRHDVVIINPPRAGVRDRISDIARLARHAVLACYCRAESFARDARGLEAGGLRLRRLWLADMFPHTAHCELLGLYVRPSGVNTPRAIL
jgi:23S rRNA (uracil1939-C5)-methyltransferase